MSLQTTTRNQNLISNKFCQRNRNILTNMKLFTFVIAITISLASSRKYWTKFLNAYRNQIYLFITTNLIIVSFFISTEDVQFGGDDEAPVSVETRADGIGEDEVNSRIFGNIDLNSFAGNVSINLHWLLIHKLENWYYGYEYNNFNYKTQFTIDRLLLQLLVLW